MPTSAEHSFKQTGGRDLIANVLPKRPKNFGRSRNAIIYDRLVSTSARTDDPRTSDTIDTAETMIPAAPIPENALAKMRKLTDVATPDRSDPISKITTENMNTHLLGKRVLSWPNIRRAGACVMKKPEGIQASSPSALKMEL